MAELDIKKLGMIMRMTESNADGEALNAVRMANRMLKAAGKTWQDVIGAPATARFTVSPDYRQPPSKRGAGDTSRYGRPASQARAQESNTKIVDPNIDVILSALGRRKMEVSSLMFVASLRDFWERNGYLTESQFDALKRMHAGNNTDGGLGRWRF